MLIYIQSFIVFILCICTSFTDIKSKKIYNKIIIYAFTLSSIVYICLWNQIERCFIINHVINVFITLILSFAFFYFKIWAAGDAKLFSLISYMIPFSMYEVNEHNVFPSMYLLILIFGVAFIYVVIETIILWIRDNKKFSNFSQKGSFIKSNWKDFIIQYFVAYFLVLLINNIILRFYFDFYRYNGALLIICNMLFITFLYRAVNKRKYYIRILAIAIILNIIYSIIFGFEFHSINIKMLFVIILLFLFRQISEKYNYENIEVEKLKPGMILSLQSVLLFFNSRVKGLPKQTTETTDSRLTKEEIDSIKRWCKTSKGQKSVVIVRHMPFAPFICIGVTIFFIFKLFL